MIQKRNKNGNMLTVVSLTIGLIVAVGMSGLTFNSLLFQHRRAQGEADTLAINLAGKINEGDRVGQLNELEECSRELLYVNGKELKQCSDEDYSFLTPLCEQLMTEARAGHQLLDRERTNQMSLLTKRVQETASSYNSSAYQHMTMTLPWLKTREPKVSRVDVGYIYNVESNVISLDAIKELSEFDRQKGYIDRTTRLYKGNINASLPDSGGDLKFPFSSLPAYVEATCSPARNTNPDVFVRSGTIFSEEGGTLDAVEQIPNAVQVSYSLKASMGPRQDFATALSLVSTGATNGAIAGSK